MSMSATCEEFELGHLWFLFAMKLQNWPIGVSLKAPMCAINRPSVAGCVCDPGKLAL